MPLLDLIDQARIAGERDKLEDYPCSPAVADLKFHYIQAYKETPMTRINCIPPSELTNKHLVAEYRELPRIFRLARSPYPKEPWPKTYTLGKGHVKFFYDKLAYLEQRFYQLVEEMISRGYKPNFTTIPKTDAPPELWNGWQPTPEAQELNRQRIKERLS